MCYNICMVLVTISRLDPYPSDLSDRQWTLLGNEFPEFLEIKNGRRLFDAFLYKFTTGIAWQSLPRDFPYPSDVQAFYEVTRDSGFLEKVLVYLGSHYKLSAVLVSRLRLKGFELDIKPVKSYEIHYGRNRHLSQ